MWKFFASLVVWLIVAVVLELVGSLLTSGGDNSGIGLWLKQNNVLIGFLAGVAYFFFGSDWHPYNRP